MSYLYTGGFNAVRMLEETLGGQPGEVLEAAYAIINNTFNPPNPSDLSWKELDALRYTRLAQAQYIADNYITDENRKELFLGSMHQLSFGKPAHLSY